jgi:hypothetical protein
MNQVFGPMRGIMLEKEYTVKTGWKIFLYIVTAAIVIGGAYSIYAAITDKTWWLALLGMGLVLLGIYLYLELKVSRIITSGNGIKIVAYFRSKELLLGDIKGYRMERNGLFIDPVDKSKKRIHLGDYSYYADYQEISAWLQTYCVDLNAQQEQTAIEEVQNDDSYGYTGEERLAELKRLKKFCSYFNYAGVAICIWMFAYPRPYDYAILTGLLWPLVVLFVFYLKRDVVTLNAKDKKKEAVYPSLNTALILPPFALLARVFIDFKLMHLTDVLLPAVTVIVVLSAVFAAIMMSAREKARSNKTTWLSALLFVLLYGFTAPVLVNCDFDYGVPKTYTAQVLDQRVSTGKHTSYNLTLSKWGPAESEEVEVNQSLYNEVKVGDTVQVNLKPGLLKMRWFYVSR